VPYEYRIIRPDGATRHVYATGELECDGAGEPLRFTGIVQDVTEQKLSEHKIQEYQRRLKSLAGELTLAEEKERHNIATELHDHVGQTLAVMRMQLAMARKEGRGRKVEAMLDEVSGLLLEVIQETRNIMSDLSSPAMNELGLAAAIAEWLSVQIGDRFSLVTRFHDDGESRSLSHDTRIILFRSVRELLMNVVKHAHATQVNISIQREHDTVKIIVEDDGTGLDAGSRGAHAAGTGGFGLFSIEERMADLGGSLVIESPPGHGVKAILTAPLSPE
jgi:signal transduction histidine kinase